MALRSSTISCSKDDAAPSPSFRCHFSSLLVRKVLRKYQQGALQSFSHRAWPSRKHLKRLKAMASSAPSENGLQCYGPSTMQPSTELDHTRRMLDASLDCTSIDMDMLQALHETARMLHLAIENERSLTKGPWFAKAWLGVDHSAWIKFIAYQAAVHALIEALLDIARRQETANLSVSSMIQKCILRLKIPLAESIRQHLCARDPAAEAWLWNQQHPIAVNNLLSNLKEGFHFAAMDTVDSNEASQVSHKICGFALFMLSLSTFASIMKLGNGKLSCLAFSCSLVEETHYLMDKLAEFSSVKQAYEFTSSIGLKDEFLKHFGLRAALHNVDFKIDKEERLFWVGLIRKLLKSSLAREGVCSKLATSSQSEIFDRSLVVFAFFTALGRRARSFLSSERVQMDDDILGLLRYLEGGYVTFCPELGTLATYQLFVEVASEDLEWLPFFDKNTGRAVKKTKNAKDIVEQLPTNDEAVETIAALLNVCSCWVDDFLLYNDTFQQTQSIEVTQFLSNIQSILCQCITATSRHYKQSESNKNLVTRAATEMEQVLKNLQTEDSVYKGSVEKAKPVYQTFDWKKVPKNFEISGDIVANIDLQELREQLKAFDEDASNVSHTSMDATKAWDFLSKSTKKVKDVSMDVLKGTQLLATDIAIAISLLQSRISGRKLTEREKRILRRTCTDLASIIPIAFLMLLPVTAVGHAAMLAAIQKYVPALIPSAYGAERLHLLKQLEKLKEMDGCVFGNNVLLKGSNK